ncbi:MAG: hypothetical protein WCJ09_08445 [Planctomycetota bacterium]
MRLTLRTLLFYLDDMLAPAETKLIGQKIQESAVAGKLVSLIRLVVRQRRLKAPSVSGPNIGIDPNVIAQYLDITLPPEEVVEVERVLLTSDELLAEVASCHQVLALSQGKTTELSAASRERLYALGPVATGDQLQIEEPKSAVTIESEVASTGAMAERNGNVSTPIAKTAAKPASSHEIPEYLRQSSWSQRIFPASVIALLITVCLGLLIFDSGFLKGIKDAKRELSKSDPGKAAVGDSSADTQKEIPAEGENSIAKVTPTEPLIPTTQPSVPSIDPLPPADAPDKPAGTDVPADAVAATRPATPTIPANTSPTTDDPVPVLNPALVQYTSNDGVVLRYDEMQHHWFLLPRRSVVPPGEHLVILEPFEASLDFDRGAVVASVMGDTALRIMPPDRTTSTGLDVRRGRIMLRSVRRDAVKPLISVRVGNELWRLEFQTPETACSIEVTPREPSKFEKSLEPNWYSGVLRVQSGSVKWTNADGEAQKLGPDSALEISHTSVKAFPVSAAHAPEWLDPQKRKQSPLRRFATNFEKQFEVDQPVENTLLALVHDPNAKITELAVRGMTLTDSTASLVQALAECSFEEGRFAARDGLRTWLARDATRGTVMKEILAQHYTPADAIIVYTLLWGFPPEDGANRAASMELVSWLRNPHTEIRELAYYWIVHLTGRKWEFRAVDAVSGRSESAVRKIEAHVTKTGALVKPTEKEKEPAPKVNF